MKRYEDMTPEEKQKHDEFCVMLTEQMNRLSATVKEVSNTITETINKADELIQ